MRMDQAQLTNVVARLRKVEGQIGGVIRMIEEGRECRDVVRQIAAASKALDRAGFKLVATGLRACLSDERNAKRSGYTEEEFETLLLSLA